MLFVIVDGIPADVLESVDPPVLKAIAAVGGYTRAHVGGDRGTYNQTPTISAPGYNSLITGTWVNKHNVWDNDIADPNYNYWTVFRTLAETNPQLTTAIFSTWTDNRTKLVGEGLKETNEFMFTTSFDGLELDTFNYPRESDAGHIRKIDDAVADEAARVVAEKGPDLSWVYLEYTDDVGHQFGDSRQQIDAVVAADQQIGRIWQAIEQRQREHEENWLLVVTTDHGRDSLQGRGHGGQSQRERTTWIVTNSKQLNQRFRNDPAIVDIYPSIFSHLDIAIPEHVARELDGVSFIGEIEVNNFRATREGSEIVVVWDLMNPTGGERGEIMVTNTNQYRAGGVDDYQKLGEVALDKKAFRFVAADSTFHKIVMKTRSQYVNTWVPAQ